MISLVGCGERAPDADESHSSGRPSIRGNRRDSERDGAAISQDTDKTDITTTTAIRLLLNQAATVEEALDMLGQYDLHVSMNYKVHFAIADAAGNSVAVEYIDMK